MLRRSTRCRTHLRRGDLLFVEKLRCCVHTDAAVAQRSACNVRFHHAYICLVLCSTPSHCNLDLSPHWSRPALWLGQNSLGKMQSATGCCRKVFATILQAILQARQLTTSDQQPIAPAVPHRPWPPEPRWTPVSALSHTYPSPEAYQLFCRHS